MRFLQEDHLHLNFKPIAGNSSGFYNLRVTTGKTQQPFLETLVDCFGFGSLAWRTEAGLSGCI